MEAGAPALILLAIMLVAAASLAHAMMSSKQYDTRQSFSAAVSLFTLPFWIWALVHCACCYFDLGAVSFASVLVVAVAANLAPATSPTCIGVLYALACAFVSANYGLAVGAFCTSALLCLYFIAGVCIWAVLALVAFKIYGETPSDSSQSESLIADSE
jgi:hypothetical protein